MNGITWFMSAACATLVATIFTAKPAVAHELSNTVSRNGVTFEIKANAVSPTGGGTVVNFDSDFSYKITHNNNAPEETYSVTWAYYLDNLLDSNSVVSAGSDNAVTVGPGEFTNTRNRHADAANIGVAPGDHWRYALIRILIQGQFDIEAQQLDEHSFTTTMGG